MRYLLFALALLFPASGFPAAAVTYTVCAAGCSMTTVNTAYAAATSIDWIQLNDNSITNEGITISKNLGGIRGATDSTTWGFNVPIGLGVTTGLTTVLPIENIDFYCSYTLGVYIWAYSTLGGTGGLAVTNCSFTDTMTGDNALYSQTYHGVNGFSAGRFTFVRCDFNGNNKTNRVGVNMASAVGGASGAVSYISCLFRNFTASASHTVPASTSVRTNTFVNCTFSKCVTALSAPTASGDTGVNSLFYGNTRDINTLYITPTNFTYCAFGQQASGAGTGCSYTISNPFIGATQGSDPSNYLLRRDSVCSRGGTPIAGVTTDLLGNAYNTTNPAIGCIEVTASFDDYLKNLWWR